MRDIILDRLRSDLVGPYSDDESLTARPSDVYLTGILWPHETRLGAEEDERLGLSGSEKDETAGSGEEEQISLTGLARPSSAGISFATATHTTEGIPELDVMVRFATYEPVTELESDEQDVNAEQRQRVKWERRAHEIRVFVALTDPPPTIDLQPLGAPLAAKLHVRIVPWSKGTLATVTLLNRAKPDKDEGRIGIERLTLFQTRLEIRPGNKTTLIARPSRRAVLDDEDRSTELLYRHAHEFATGHTCSAEWEPSTEPNTATMVATSWIPITKVPATSAFGHQVFDALRNDETIKPLSARWLANAGQDDLRKALNRLPAAYEKWIKDREADLPSLPERHRNQGTKNIANCREVQRRITEGAVRITEIAEMSRAFRLANLAMDIQYGWVPKKNMNSALEWRPFQLGFILLAAASIAEREHPERRIMDLLWFPTGGGKTEAYLALIAFLAFYRRLSNGNAPDTGNGVAAIMRYTLRLLTTQQFTRSASVMLACEAIRRGRIPDANISEHELGSTAFSIGLWVGGDATPNRFKNAVDALGGTSDHPTPRQLLHCPACHERLKWFSDEQDKAIYVKCENEDCLLFDPQENLPIWTVDDDVYREKPTLLIGTIDKFAQIVRRKEVNMLFGLRSGNPPDLILQDELHLISGPLGTIAGLYEVAIDRMFAARGNRPKIIGSTATIRRASEQVGALFERETSQFPPPCLDASDSAFAVVDKNAPGRVYAGVTSAGRSAKFALQGVATSLLQSACDRRLDDTERDPYWTLVSYFNSLRELGGALVLMQDDVNDSLALLAKRREENRRRPEFIEELTSRRTQAEIRDMLERLSVHAADQEALDIVLATNMLSVGVDIPRLGLMLVHGQPKGTAEYIQATSRVGRGDVQGLVVAVLNNARARDRSHYESFSTWHKTLYRDVEPTSVTPFASRARDRALHAVLVAIVRHLVPGMIDHPTLNEDAISAAKELIDDITKRASQIDPQETDVKTELEHCLDTWEFREPRSYWQSRQVHNSLLQDAEWAAKLRAMGRMPGEAWPTLNNMRSVEASTMFRLAERLSASKVRENANDK